MGSDSSEKVVNQLLTELDGVEELENVMVVAATNRKDLIDEALLRPGRIDAHVELSNPDLETRKEIFKVHTKNMPLEKDINLDEMAKNSDGWTGADIEAVCRNAGISSIKRNYKEKDLNKVRITKEDFEKAMGLVKKQKGGLQENKKAPSMEDLKGLMPNSDVKDAGKVSKKKASSKKKTSLKKKAGKK